MSHDVKSKMKLCQEFVNYKFPIWQKKEFSLTFEEYDNLYDINESM